MGVAASNAAAGVPAVGRAACADADDGWCHAGALHRVLERGQPPARAGAGRRREISVRAALGAGRGRIVTATADRECGARAAERSARDPARSDRHTIDRVRYSDRPGAGRRALGARLEVGCVYTSAIAAGTAIVFGLFPALQVSRGNLHDTLKEGTRGNSVAKSFLRSTLVVAQVAFALVALVGALLFVRSFWNLGAFDIGFDTKPLMSMRFYMPGAVYEEPDAKLRRVEDIVRRVEALPGVRATFASNLVPLGSGGGGGIRHHRRPPGAQRRGERHLADRRHATFQRDARAEGRGGTRLHRCGRVVAFTGRGDQPEDGAAVLAGRRRDRRAVPA